MAKFIPRFVAECSPPLSIQVRYGGPVDFKDVVVPSQPHFVERWRKDDPLAI